MVGETYLFVIIEGVGSWYGVISKRRDIFRVLDTCFMIASHLSINSAMVRLQYVNCHLVSDSRRCAVKMWAAGKELAVQKIE